MAAILRMTDPLDGFCRHSSLHPSVFFRTIMPLRPHVSAPFSGTVFDKGVHSHSEGVKRPPAPAGRSQFNNGFYAWTHFDAVSYLRKVTAMDKKIYLSIMIVLAVATPVWPPVYA